MTKYSLRDGSTGDVIDKINEAVSGKVSADQVGNFVMKNAGNLVGGSNSPATSPAPPINTAQSTDNTTESMTKHAIPVAVGGATTLGIKYGLKKGWGMALAGGVLTGAAAHYIKNKQETV
jgi:hypothetical protein